MADDDIRKHGPITEYRPEKDDVSGGRDKSVQSEATGAEGSSNLAQSGTTSGGAAGRINDLDHNPTPKRGGGERDENPDDLTR